MEISACVKYVGVNDHQVDLFEGQYKVPNGMSYNSYVILDDKIAVMDTVDGFFTEEWLNNIEQVLDGKMPDYLVIQHMEPDHSASIPAFLKKYPKATVVSIAKGFQFMERKPYMADLAFFFFLCEEIEDIVFWHITASWNTAPPRCRR